MERVENGETIGVENANGDRAVMTPADEEILRIYTDHEEGCQLTNHPKLSIITRSTFIKMTLTTKFKKDLQTLRATADGEIFLDVKNPKLFKKVRRYYENNGVVFSGDALDDYDILVDCLVQDLESVEAV